MALATLAAARLDSSGGWIAYNTLTAGHAAIALMLLAIAGPQGITRGQRESGRRLAAGWVVLQGAIVLALSAHTLGTLRDVWWIDGGVGFVGLLLAPATAWVYRRSPLPVRRLARWSTASACSWPTITTL